MCLFVRVHVALPRMCGSVEICKRLVENGGCWWCALDSVGTGLALASFLVWGCRLSKQ